MNYEEDLRIDENALDIEWLGQAQLMMKYTEIQASNRREVDRLKEKLNLVKAELDRDIRKDPEKFKITVKITEAVVTGCILEQKKYKKAMSASIDAQYEYQMAGGAVQAVEQRKQALENLSRLLGLQYFAGPSMPRDLPKEVQQNQQKIRSNQAIEFTRKKED